MSGIDWPKLKEYSLHGCTHLGSWRSHEIGCTRRSDDVLVLWMLRVGTWAWRDSYLERLNTVISSDSPAQIVKAFNREVCKLPDIPVWAEICLMRLDQSEHTLTRCAAGGFPLWARTPDGKISQFERSKESLPLGVATEVDCDEQLTELTPGMDVLLVSPYTTQIGDGSGMYGIARIEKYFETAPADPLLITEGLANDIQQFVGEREPDEDICLICLRRSA